ncbi:hypothetical protein FOPG_11391 [Fusarium oxysporum f. sp. conglutinans race 2 54008]|uniref:NACHT-NTPase and P-loop NTPases N-terminal domain-containing protein n=1 Tax=Fusarium oxysporum f. sp. conglutinans race 2 54008 TaxID=1089457 RepID=X0HNX0_FUSOX|nr:hypothetical protein FOPG_11391 [Fusarium oxysporum f. sp. conglutinans race 2 54008]
MSFGYSIGDLIAIAGLIERIVVEVKSYKEAPHHFQRLAIELDFLSKVCHQAFHLIPSRVGEQARLESTGDCVAMPRALARLRKKDEELRQHFGPGKLHRQEYKRLDTELQEAIALVGYRAP